MSSLVSSPDDGSTFSLSLTFRHFIHRFPRFSFETLLRLTFVFLATVTYTLTCLPIPVSAASLTAPAAPVSQAAQLQTNQQAGMQQLSALVPRTPRVKVT